MQVAHMHCASPRAQKAVQPSLLPDNTTVLPKFVVGYFALLADVAGLHL